MNNTGIDESQYSRQLHTFGAEAQKALENTSVLISGLSGLGVEIAKCVIMTGVKSVTLHDTKQIDYIDLSSNYYASETDVGKQRIDVVKNKLAALNSKVNVVTNIDPLSESHAKRHQVIVVCDSTIQQQVHYNELARQYGTRFIMANTFGLLGSIFCDFGDEFVSCDPDGETPVSGILTHILNENFVTNEPHKLYNGDIVNIKIDNNREYTDEVIKVLDQNVFKTKKGKMKDQLFNNSEFTQVKQHMTLNFKSLEESYKNPEFSMVMVEDFDRQRLLHDFFVELGLFVQTHGELPRPWNDDDMNELLQKVKCENETQTNVIKKLCYTTRGKLVEMDSIIGPIVAQEVMKAASKKYTPVKQWMYVDNTDTLQNEKLTDSEFTDIPNDRYLGRILVYGKTLQKKLGESSIFVIGAGAIGCEHLKNLALMGVKNIVVTDMDTIEKSNLNRQFLFTNSDIGKSKSEAARNAILQMNPNVNVTAQQNKICQDTLQVYNEEFFSQFTCVLTALDNVEARLFVDYLCLQHGKPLIDSGTLGTKGNIQVIVPKLTESYGASRDPPENEIPMCTLKNFPYLIEHCIQWSRDIFEGLFVRMPQDFVQYKSNPNKFRSLTESDRNQLTEMVNNVNFVKTNVACHMKECIQLAYKLWHEHFRDHIYHLTKKFPANCVTTENLPFWTGSKKFPTIGTFTGTDINIAFIESFANLWADVCGLNERVTLKQIQQFLKKANPPEIKGEGGIIAENEKQQKELEEQLTDKTIEELINSLPELNEIEGINVKALEFEKDDDTNFHIDFVTSTSNSRADAYKISTTDKFNVKKIAGKIIPAIVTTTSLVSGMVASQLIQVIKGCDKIEQYNNSFVNLALPVIAFSEPIKIGKMKVGKFEYTLWDKIVFDDVTVKQLMSVIAEKVQDDNLQIGAISSGPFQLYSINHSQNLIKKRQCMKISDIYSDVTKETPSEYILLMVSMEKIDDENEDDDDDDDCDPIECRIKMY